MADGGVISIICTIFSLVSCVVCASTLVIEKKKEKEMNVH